MNNIHKRIIYILVILYSIYILNKKLVENFDLKDSNPYKFESSDNPLHYTFNFYKENYEKLKNNEQTDIDLIKYGWPITFNTETKDYLDKTRFLETTEPIPTNGDFFIT